LARGTGSFTLHGKKASVVTFGSEWQNMSQEQGLKMRKPSVAEDSKASETLAPSDGGESILSGSVAGKRAFSFRSTSTATARSLRNQERVPSADGAPKLPEMPTGTVPIPSEQPAPRDCVDEDNAEPAQILANPSSLVPQSHNPDAIDESEIERSASREGHGDAANAESHTPREGGTLLAHSITQGRISPVRSEQAVSA